MRFKNIENPEVVLVVWVLFVLGLLSMVGMFTGKPDDLEQQRALYCEMVETFKATGDEYGWPDYKGSYGRDCK